jgi:hypothetical protein
VEVEVVVPRSGTACWWVSDVPPRTPSGRGPPSTSKDYQTKTVRETSTFQEAGALTVNRDLVVAVDVFRITIVQSAQAR